MSSAIAGYIAAAIFVPLFFRLLGKLVPPASKEEQAPLAPEETRKYGRLYARWTFIFIALTAALAYPLYLLLVPLSGLLAPSGNPAFELVAMPVSWAIVAMFGGMLVSATCMELYVRRALGLNYGKYVRFQDEKHKYNTLKVLPWIYGSLLAIVLFGTVTAASVFVHVYPDRVVRKGVFDLMANELQFRDIETIRTAPLLIAPNGNRVQRREFEIVFSGDVVWTTRWSPQDLSEDKKWEIARYISKHSGVEISELEVLE